MTETFIIVQARGLKTNNQLHWLSLINCDSGQYIY